MWRGIRGKASKKTEKTTEAVNENYALVGIATLLWGISGVRFPFAPISGMAILPDSSAVTLGTSTEGLHF